MHIKLPSAWDKKQEHSLRTLATRKGSSKGNKGNGFDADRNEARDLRYRRRLWDVSDE